MLWALLRKPENLNADRCRFVLPGIADSKSCLGAKSDKSFGQGFLRTSGIGNRLDNDRCITLRRDINEIYPVYKVKPGPRAGRKAEIEVKEEAPALRVSRGGVPVHGLGRKYRRAVFQDAEMGRCGDEGMHTI